jgi:hypothetical protein
MVFQTEKSGPRIAVLGAKRDGAQLQKTETEAGKHAGAFAILVKTRREAYGILKFYARHGYGQVSGTRQQLHEKPGRLHLLRGADALHHDVVDQLGVKSEKYPAKNFSV